MVGHGLLQCLWICDWGTRDAAESWRGTRDAAESWRGTRDAAESWRGIVISSTRNRAIFSRSSCVSQLLKQLIKLSALEARSAARRRCHRGAGVTIGNKPWSAKSVKSLQLW